MCDSWICTDENFNITLNGDGIGYWWFIGAYIAFRFFEHFLSALYYQHNRELLQLPPNERPCEDICSQMGFQFGRSFFAVLSFLLILEKNWIMFIFLIFFDVVFVPIRFRCQKKDKKYTSVKQELYELFMHIDHDPNDETYNKLVIYMNKMKNKMKKDGAATIDPKPKYSDMLF